MYKIYRASEIGLVAVVVFDTHKEAAAALSEVCPKPLARTDCFSALQICRSAKAQGVQVTRLHVSASGEVYCVGGEVEGGEDTRVAA